MKINLEMTSEEYEDYISYRKDKKTIECEVEIIKSEYETYKQNLIEDYKRKLSIRGF